MQCMESICLHLEIITDGRLAEREYNRIMVNQFFFNYTEEHVSLEDIITGQRLV